MLHIILGMLQCEHFLGWKTQNWPHKTFQIFPFFYILHFIPSYGAASLATLTLACNQTCNFHEDDPTRNFMGIKRSYVPCEAPHVKTSQCIPEEEKRDGVYNCRNRGDELAFATSYDNSTSLLMNLEELLISCTSNGSQGFMCMSLCVPTYLWCNPYVSFNCKELKGKSATGKTIDPMLCSNQSFWEGKPCDGGPRAFRIGWTKKTKFGFRPQSSACAFFWAKLSFMILFKFIDP